MKTIYKGRDDLYYVVSVTTEDGTPLSPSELDALTIQFFTKDGAPGSRPYEKSDITEEGVLYVDADTLAGMPDGPLKARFFISLTDSGFTDGKYDTVTDRLTGYFLKTLPVGN